MNLVIQGLDVETQDLKTLAKLTQANGIEQVRPNVFRLAHCTPHPDVPACASGPGSISATCRRVRSWTTWASW